LYRSSLGLRVIKKKKKERWVPFVLDEGGGVDVRALLLGHPRELLLLFGRLLECNRVKESPGR